MPKKEAEFVRSPDTLEVEDPTWLNLGQLRSLVRLADERNWPDSSLISVGTDGEHPSKRGLQTATTIVIEGSDPQQ